MQALNEYQRALGISQTELAKRLGVTQGQLSYWMRKRRSPRIESLKLIAEKTGISLDKLTRDL